MTETTIQEQNWKPDVNPWLMIAPVMLATFDGVSFYVRTG